VPAVTNIGKALVLVLGAAVSALGQNNFSLCDINHDHAVNVLDVQAMDNQAGGTLSPANDLNLDGVVNVVDVQSEVNVILYGCPYFSVTPRFTITSVSLLNQAWIPSDIPSAGNLTIRGAQVASVSLVNQAWIPADIPSPGDVRFAAGLLVSVNNTGAGRTVPNVTSLGVKVIAAGSSTAPVDLSSVNDGDGLIAGQTVRFRVYPPDGTQAGSDFLVDGAPLKVHTPFEVLVTAPANASGFDLQAVIYGRDGRVWRTQPKHLAIVPDPGQTLSGRALDAESSSAGSVSVGVRTNGLTAEYFRADQGIASWAALNRPADKQGFVTAVNQPNTTAFGPDPFGTGFAGNYATSFRGQILAAIDGQHQFFLDAPLGARLTIDGATLIDTPPGSFSPEAQAAVTLPAGWHTIEIDSYQPAFNGNLQLSWRQPNSAREIVRPESLATESGPLAVTDGNGSFRVNSFPNILNPLEWHTVPADSKVRVTLDQSVSEERPIQQ
jgi:hypothetical protein